MIRSHFLEAAIEHIFAEECLENVHGLPRASITYYDRDNCVVLDSRVKRYRAVFSLPNELPEDVGELVALVEVVVAGLIAELSEIPDAQPYPWERDNGAAAQTA